MNIKCIVIADNASGEADFWACIVDCTERQYNEGDHFETAEVCAENERYENTYACDEHEPLFKPFLNIVDWNKVPILKC